ncbi:ammonium transporter [Mangrovimicrobium sediminis]|uniref:Ammonium transporter n=1 Tax=Mangrovimicrobium sediminis TaxID=2562682 RepID=A0A4Z0M258_9GAMM|nr:ammonium transporter [Haliea sp. SAOS-164]TGD73609.1 ammonium transporter [Haliea sp. SAOS-164]
MSDKSALDLLWVLLAAVLVLLMQGGFLCLESGVTRTKNAINVALKNAVDLALVWAVFWLFSFGLMFGATRSGLLGGSYFAPDIGHGDAWLSTFFLFQVMFCATAATIVSGAVAERMRFQAYIVITVLVAGLLYPVFGHWAWGGALGDGVGWLADLGFVDFAGSTVVHSVGGWVALAAVILLGPRLGRFAPGSGGIPPSNMPLAMFGVVLFFVGWVGFNGGSTLAFDGRVPGIIANTLLSGAVGMIAAHLLRPLISPDMTPISAPLNGALAGLVSITANCHVVSSGSAALIGAIGAAVMLATDRALLRLKLDDAVGAIPVHLGAGIWGTLAVAVFGDLTAIGNGLSRGEQLLAQLQGVAACGVWSFAVGYLLLRLVAAWIPLRVSVEEEEQGLNVSEHGARNYLSELLGAIDRQERSADLTLRAPVEPFTEMGQVAQSYNRLIDALQGETEKTADILRQVRDGIITFDASGRLTSLNPGAEQLLGVRTAAVVGTSALQVINDAGFVMYNEGGRPVPVSRDLQSTLRCEFQRAEDGGAKTVLEFKASRANGIEGTVYTATLRDISRQRRVEEQLFEEKEQAQVTLKSLGEAVITADADDRILYMNPVAAEFIGIGESEAIGQNLAEAFSVTGEADGCAIQLGLAALGQGGTGIRRHDPLILHRRDGTEVTIKLTAAPIRDRNGGMIGTVLVFQDISSARELERTLSYQASHDAVTGLYNRRKFEDCLLELIESARESEQEHVICFADLDQFKVVNDTCGHHAGDELLRQLANLLADSVRASDTLARLGGDEFGILLHECDMERGRQIADEVRRRVEEYRFSWQGRTFAVGVSIGLVGFNQHDGNAVELMSMADTACYAAKEGGRNRVHVHSRDDEQVDDRRGQMVWATRIREAIDQDRLRLFYQPIVYTDDTTRIDHYEVFVRMLTDDGDTVPPGAFIPAAERYGHMSGVDLWVVRNMLAWMGASAQRDTSFSINLSGASLDNAEMLRTIKSGFTRFGVNPEQVCFEVTETAAIADFSRAVQFIDELKRLGCRFSLDDFGSGLSSFGYLKSLPVDFIKIDGMFVRDILTDPFDEAMVQSINRIGQLMGLITIAEFVESEDILRRLQQIGVDLCQGYHIAAPAPLEEHALALMWPR